MCSHIQKSKLFLLELIRIGHTMIREHTPVHCVQKPEEDAYVWECVHIYACVCRILKRRHVCESVHTPVHIWICTQLCMCVKKPEDDSNWFFFLWLSILLQRGLSLNLAFYLLSLLLSHQACWLVNLSDLLSLCLLCHPFVLESLDRVAPEDFVLLLGSVRRLPCWHSEHLSSSCLSTTTPTSGVFVKFFHFRQGSAVTKADAECDLSLSLTPHSCSHRLAPSCSV